MSAQSFANRQWFYVRRPEGRVGPEHYELRDSVRNLLKRSFPNPGDDAEITAMFDRHVDDDSLGIPPARRDGGEIFYAYPVVILATRK